MSFQAGHIPSWRGSCGSYALSPGAGVWRWLLLLLSPLLSAPIRRAAGHDKTLCVVCRPSFPAACAASAPATFRPGRGPGAPPLPSIGLTAAALFAGGEVSRADSRVRSPGTFTCARCPAVRSALDAGPEAYDNPAAVWWGACAPSSFTSSWALLSCGVQSRLRLEGPDAYTQRAIPRIGAQPLTGGSNSWSGPLSWLRSSV